jgi:hypothetical protein
MKSILPATIAAAYLVVANVAYTTRQNSNVASATQYSTIETIITNPVSAPDAIRILFIGNSYIYVNNLPGILTSLGNSPESPHQIQTAYVTIGGANLEKLWSECCALAMILKTRWDYVVLQEGAPHLIADPINMAKYVRLFDAEIKKSGAGTILFLPWPDKSQREAQPAMNGATYQIAKELGAKVAPIGPAWNIAQSLKSDIGLYQTDQRHATPTGSYLAACTIYVMLMGHQKSCPAIEQSGVTPDEGTVVRAAASQALNNAP